MENPDDKRSRSILLTEKSNQLEETFFQLSDQLEAEFTKCLSEKEKVQAVKLLVKIPGGGE